MFKFFRKVVADGKTPATAFLNPEQVLDDCERRGLQIIAAKVEDQWKTWFLGSRRFSMFKFNIMGSAGVIYLRQPLLDRKQRPGYILHQMMHSRPQCFRVSYWTGSSGVTVTNPGPAALLELGGYDRILRERTRPRLEDVGADGDAAILREAEEYLSENPEVFRHG